MEVACIVIEIPKVVVGLNVTRIAFQGESEIVQGFDKLSLLEIDYPQIAVSFCCVVSFMDRFKIMRGCPWFALPAAQPTCP